MNNSSNKHSKKLMTIWWVSVVIAMIISSVYVYGFAPNDCLPPVTLPWEYQLIVLIFVGIYLYPLLFLIWRYAKREKQKTIRVIATILIVWISFFLVTYLFLLITDPLNLLM